MADNQIDKKTFYIAMIAASFTALLFGSAKLIFGMLDKNQELCNCFWGDKAGIIIFSSGVLVILTLKYFLLKGKKI